MLTRKKLILLIMPLFFLIQCSMWYKITKSESKLYTPQEKTILDETTMAMDFRYGFEPDLELDYIYMAGNFSQKELDAREKIMKDILLKHKPEEVVAFYEKIYRLIEILSWNAEYYRKKEKWTKAILIEKYLLPDSKKYFEMLEKNVILIDVNYRKTIEERKRIIKQQVIEDLD